MRRFYRHLVLPFYRIWALRYIRKPRIFRYGGLNLSIPPGVFHPGIFFSTPVFLRFFKKNVGFEGQNTLDLGTGSGILALWAAQNGATATATDINPAAVACAAQNASRNQLELTALVSDLFDDMPAQKFDRILINPPWYARKTENMPENAFFAGENLDYFHKLFGQLPQFCHLETQIFMILSEDSAPETIRTLAAYYHFSMTSVYEEKRWGEQFLVFKINAPH